jgi:microcystin-dependent protein
MSLETATYLHQLNVANPAGSDKLQQGDDHLRLIKAVLKNTFPNLTGAMTLTQQFLNTTMPAQLVPFGVITAWYGDDSAVPAGWAVCNGQTVAKSDGTGNITVPDLRDRTIVGVSASHAEGSTFGQFSKTVTSEAGGSHSHTGSAQPAGAHSHGGATSGTALTEAQMPTHSHYLTKIGISNDTLSSSNYLSQERTAGGDTEYILMGTSSVPDVGKSGPAGSGQVHSHAIAEQAAHSHDLSVGAVPGHAHALTMDVTQPSMALHYIMKI